MANESWLDDGPAFSGFVVGLLFGGLWWLLRGPRLRLAIRTKVKPGNDKGSESLENSIEAAKAFARHRKDGVDS